MPGGIGEKVAPLSQLAGVERVSRRMVGEKMRTGFRAK